MKRNIARRRTVSASAALALALTLAASAPSIAAADGPEHGGGSPATGHLHAWAHLFATERGATDSIGAPGPIYVNPKMHV